MSSEPLEIRPVRPEERDAACRWIHDPPGPELLAMAGDAARAAAFGRGLLARAVHPSPDHEVHAAFAAGRPVGVLVLESGAARGRTGLPIGAVVPLALRVFPPWRLPRLAWLGWLRSRLDFPVPGDALHVVELHVAPERRGRGVGGRLLDHAETLARERGHARLVLSTLATNPARRLYERHGYRTTAERRVRGYRAATGSPGRVFLEKALDAAPPA